MKNNIMKESNIKIKLIDEHDYRFLYNLLKERDPKTNISHHKMPSYSEHLKFIKSKPYSKWYIIFDNRKKVGSVYLTKMNEIGIFLKKETQKKGIGKYVLKQIFEKNPRKRYLANVSPNNLVSQNFFKKNGFHLIQYTYELIPGEI